MNWREKIKEFFNGLKDNNENKMAVLYSVVYVVFISVLLLLGTRARAQKINLHKNDPIVHESHLTTEQVYEMN